MLAGISPKCGTYYSGWALKSPASQICQKCGEKLVIKNDEGGSEQVNWGNLHEKNLKFYLTHD
jgi:hypothetical protein